MDLEHGVPLENLLRRLPQNTRVVGSTEKTVRGLTLDSREAADGSLFIAIRGERADGHNFIEQAVQGGACAVVMEELLPVPPGVTAIVVPDSARAASQLADAFFGAPSEGMLVAGITGTNGKTTATQMTAAIFEAAGIPAATIGTIGARFHERTWQLQHTTPPAPELQALLRQLRDLGAKAAAMEVSSHALALQRAADVHFSIGALTNVTRDHLDFHKSFDAYAAAKRHLFDLAPKAVFNADDELGERWAGELRARKPVLTYAIDRAADVRAQDVEVRAGGSSFRVDGQSYSVRIPGRFNVANALCALAISRFADVSERDAAAGLESLERVAGRMEHVRGAGVDVVVDYAHTPDALENALRTLRETARSRVVVVFGCGGDRDRGKRPQMGAAAAKYADYSIVTSDNPRSEDPLAIVAEILAGIENAPHAVEPDRRLAIERAVREAGDGDVVLIAGKGHEAYQIVGTRVQPFDDVEVAREALAQKAAFTP